MLSTTELLAQAKHLAGDVTDYRLAKLLGVPPATVSNYRVGRTKPANPIAMRLGELAGVDPAEAVAWVNIERAASDEDREFWEFMLGRVAAGQRGKKAS
jgi:plasmid maintenance system antidote protein VapI